MTEKEESFILIHSLREANLPKFLAEDVPLFESILADLFPGVKPPDPDHGILEVCKTHYSYWMNIVFRARYCHFFFRMKQKFS